MTPDCRFITKSVQNHVNLPGFGHQSMLALSTNSMNQDYPQHPAWLRLSEPSLSRFHCLQWWGFYAFIRGFLTFLAAFSDDLLQRELPQICPSPDMDCLPDSRSTQTCLLGFIKRVINSFSLCICRKALVSATQKSLTHFLSGQKSLTGQQTHVVVFSMGNQKIHKKH